MVKTPAKAAGPSFTFAHTWLSLSRLQSTGLSPPRPAWEAGGTRAPVVGTKGFQTRQTCSLCLGEQVTPWPKPSGQSNQLGQVWAGMFGTAVMPPRPQPARLPVTGVPSMARLSVVPPQNGLSVTRWVALGLVCRTQAPSSSAEMTLVRRIKPCLINLSWVHSQLG